MPSLIFLASAILGLFIPAIDRAPTWLILAMMGAVIFFACFKVAPAELKSLGLRQPLAIYALRFVLLPVLTYAIARALVPERAAVVLLMALMPPAVSVPGLTAMIGGDVAFSLAMLVGATVVTPFVVPPLVELLAGGTLEVEPWPLARTLIFAVLLPIAVHFPLRRFASLRAAISRHLGQLSVLLIALSIFFGVAQRREILFSGRLEFGLVFALYALLYGAGFLYPGVDRARRMSLVLCSGANNIILGISLAVLHLAPEDGAFAVLCVLPWALGISAPTLASSAKRS